MRTIVADRTDHAALARALAGEHADALVDVTYAPTTGSDVDAVVDALGDRVGHAVFVSTGRVYDHCHAVYTTAKIRRELLIRPRYTLAAGIAQTFEWYLAHGLDRRDVDFSADDAILANIGRAPDDRERTAS